MSDKIISCFFIYTDHVSSFYFIRIILLHKREPEAKISRGLLFTILPIFKVCQNQNHVVYDDVIF